jgi:hypothetical protein
MKSLFICITFIACINALNTEKIIQNVQQQQTDVNAIINAAINGNFSKVVINNYSIYKYIQNIICTHI